MPPLIGKTGNLCIWLVSVTFFIFLISGGLLLVLYIVLPESSTTMWFPAAGMILVGIPWAFWLMTCFYRFMKWQSAPAPTAGQQGKAPIANPAMNSAATATRPTKHNETQEQQPTQENATGEGSSAQNTAAFAVSDLSLASSDSDIPLVYSMS